MIKKDIDLSLSVEEILNEENAESTDIDQIFADADQQMSSQIKHYIPKTKKQKRKRFLKGFLIAVGIFILIVAIVVYLLISSFNAAFPGLKTALIDVLTQAQEQLADIDRSTLSEIDACCVDIILLISIDKVEQNIENIYDLTTFVDAINQGMRIEDDFVEEQDRETFKQLIQKLKQLESEGHVRSDGLITVAPTTG